MFFILSKILGFFALPSNLSHLDRPRRPCAAVHALSARSASWLVVTSVVLIAVAGLSPLGNALILPLEQRFPPWDASRGAPDGIVVLGGAITPDVSAARGAVALNEAAERITAAAELARRYPDARIIFSGGTMRCSPTKRVEAAIAVAAVRGARRCRTTASRPKSSRATPSRTPCSRGLIANPKPGERWLLVTSAYHMPRAMAAFRAAGFAGRGLSGRLAHARTDRCAAAVSPPSATACAAPTPPCASGSAFWPTGSPARPRNCSRRRDSGALTVPENSRLILGLFTNPSSRAPMLAGLRIGFKSGEKCCVTSRRDVLGGLDKHVYGYACRARN